MDVVRVPRFLPDRDDHLRDLLKEHFTLLTVISMAMATREAPLPDTAYVDDSHAAIAFLRQAWFPRRYRPAHSACHPAGP
jgi:hypothetical protein